MLFGPGVEGNWQRRNHLNTLRHMVCTIEVKASERAGSPLSVAEISRDIAKLAAHRDEVAHLGGTMAPVMMVIDVALRSEERMLAASINTCQQTAKSEGVESLYAAAHDL